MKTTTRIRIAYISIVLSLCAMHTAFGAERHAVAQVLPDSSITIAPPTVQSPIFTHIPDVAHLGVNHKHI